MSINEFKGEAGSENDPAKAKLADAPGGPVAQAKAKPAVAVTRAKPAKPAESWVETLQTIGIALLIALFVRSFLFQPFNIPSGSMENTLLVGDFLFVNKFAYGYSRHSLPFSLPLIPGPSADNPKYLGRILFSEPRRGDVIVFKTPSDNRTDYIKRLIGLPGDRIQVKSGVLYINGVAVPKVPVPNYLETNRYGETRSVPRYRETLPGGKSYFVLDRNPDGGLDNTDEYVVPAGHYFMMGDNRDNSTDSRVPTSMNGVGYVPAVNLVGKAEVLFFSVKSPEPAWAIWRWPLSIRYGRIFNMID